MARRGEVPLVARAASGPVLDDELRCFLVPDERGREGLGVVLSHQRAGLAIDNGFRDAGMDGRDDGEARRHRLEDGERQSFLISAGCSHAVLGEDVTRQERLLHFGVRRRPVHRDRVHQREPIDVSQDIGSEWAVAVQVESHVGACVEGGTDRSHEPPRVLLRNEAPHGNDSQWVVSRGPSRASRRRANRLHTVRIDQHVLDPDGFEPPLGMHRGHDDRAGERQESAIGIDRPAVEQRCREVVAVAVDDGTCIRVREMREKVEPAIEVLEQDRLGPESVERVHSELDCIRPHPPHRPLCPSLLLRLRPGSHSSEDRWAWCIGCRKSDHRLRGPRRIVPLDVEGEKPHPPGRERFAVPPDERLREHPETRNADDEVALVQQSGLHRVGQGRTVPSWLVPDDDGEIEASGPEPVVSVVMPVKNREDLVGDAVESVLAQSFVELELIAVDDGSADGTGQVLQNLAQRDDRLRVRSLVRSAGAGAARNLAAAAARGRFLSFQDSDTVWPEGRLERHVAALDAADSDVGIVYGLQESSACTGRRRLPGDGDLIRSGQLDVVLLRHNIVDLPASTMRTAAFRSVNGFDERLPRYQDWDLFLRLSARTRFLFDDAVAVTGRDNLDRISLDRAAHFEALTILLAEHGERFRRWPACDVAWRMQCVRRAVDERDWREVGRQLAAVRRHPAATARWLGERVTHAHHIIDRARPLQPDELPTRMRR